MLKKKIEIKGNTKFWFMNEIGLVFMTQISTIERKYSRCIPIEFWYQLAAWGENIQIYPHGDNQSDLSQMQLLEMI